jgi:hypothetical protein
VSAGKCTSCHDPHAQNVVNVSATSCGRCHFDETTGLPVTTFAQITDQRQFGFTGDIDGDGIEAGLDVEIAGLEAKLYQVIQAYAQNVVGKQVCQTTPPDNNLYNYSGTGACSTSKKYSYMTPRLLKAGFNLLFAQADFGGWAHNPRYVIEILYDSITDLNAGLVANGQAAVPFAGLRSFDGHFGAADSLEPGGGMAFSDWNATGFTGSSAACSQCHGGKVGLDNYLLNSGLPIVSTPATPVTGMQCTTCHAPTASSVDMTAIRSDITNVYFPPQKAATGAGQVVVAASTTPESFALCGSCHSGRENQTTVDLSFAGKTGVKWDVSFKNPHYLGAAGIMLGSITNVMYQTGGTTVAYAAKPAFWGAVNGNAPGPHGSPHGAACTGCHNPEATRHTFEVDLATSIPGGQTGTPKACNGCHIVEPYGDFRLQPRKDNVAALSALLYTTIQSYANLAISGGNTYAKPVCYNGAAYPYWYVDIGGACGTGAQAKFDFKAAKAAYNYKWSQAEPGAYAHNYEYMMQNLIDSIMDLDPTVTLPVDAYATGGPMAAGTKITRP